MMRAALSRRGRAGDRTGTGTGTGGAGAGAGTSPEGGSSPDGAVRGALEAFHRDGLLVLEGLPTHDEAAWVNATRRAFVSLLPISTQVLEGAYWHRGDASEPSFNDFTNEGRQATLLDANGRPSDSSSGAAAAPEHPGWYGGGLKLHSDGCFLREPPRLKLFAPWGHAAVSSFADSRRALESLRSPHVVKLRESDVTVTYERKYGVSQPVLRPDGTFCWNPGDACEVQRNESDAMGAAAFDALAEALETADLQVSAGTGMAFVVDNHRVLHGRLGVVEGRRRVVGGEAPARAVKERWAQLAQV